MNSKLVDAAARGQTRRLLKLLDLQKADLSCNQDAGSAALIAAAKRGHVSIVNLLLDQGVDVNAQNDEGATALSTAVSWDQREVMLCLLNRGAYLSQDDPGTLGAFLRAATLGQADVLHAFLRRGVDANYRTERGATALMRAAQHGHDEIVSILIEHEAEINARKYSSGSTALKMACARGHANVVRRLIQAGAQVDLQDKKGNTALIHAARKNYPVILSMLLEAGADPYVIGEYGRTALSRAATADHTEIIRRLLAWEGGHPARKLMQLQTDDHGDSPLILAARAGRVDVVKLLMGSDEADFNDPCILADKDRLSSQLALRNEQGDTALMEATLQGHSEIVELLLHRGADPNMENSTGRTALMVAAAGDVGLAKLLVEYGANAHETDRKGNSAFSIAERRAHDEMIRLLTQFERPSERDEIMIAECDLASVISLMPLHRSNELDTGITVASESGRAAFAMARLVSEHDSATLLLGESGSGKDFLAQYIHHNSSRASNAFRTVNCAALPNNLVESELFGHEKGSFSGATNQKKGVFEIANGGTVFLNEIGDMPLELQAKLLTFLDSYRFVRVGGHHEIEADLRIIAATNKDLKKEVQAGNFRSDLYHRLAVWLIRLPPLRERLDDLPIIARNLLADLCERTGRTPPKVSQASLKKLRSYRWEGNIRELRNCLDRALILCDGGSIEPQHIYLDSTPEENAPEPSPPRSVRHGPGIDKRKQRLKPTSEELRAAHAEYIRGKGWSRGRLAKHMGVDSSTLKKWFKEAGLPAGKPGRPRKGSDS